MAPVGDELRRSAGVLIIQVASRHHITSLLHWLKAPEWIQFKLAVLTYRCIHGMALTYLADELLQPSEPTDLGMRTCLRSALTASLYVCGTWLLTVGNQAFPVAAAPTWNELPCHVTSAPSLYAFRGRLKMHLFGRSCP